MILSYHDWKIQINKKILTKFQMYQEYGRYCEKQRNILKGQE